MPLYQLQSESEITQIKPSSFKSERELQKLFEANLYQFLGVHFIASEFTTGKRQRGRIDTLGLDQDGSPTIIEYKKTSKENIINQGLFYMDWLVDHKGDFTIAVQEALGSEKQIDWSHPRLILIAESFSEYDKYAVNRIGSNIELWAYHRYGEDFLYLDPIFVSNPQAMPSLKVAIDSEKSKKEASQETPVYSLEDHLAGKSQMIRDLLEQLRERVFALADEDDITEKFNLKYIGYKHGKNFCEVKVQSTALKIWLDIPFSDLDDPQGQGRDVSKIGHYGTGQVELKISKQDELDYLMGLVEQSYRQTF